MCHLIEMLITVKYTFTGTFHNYATDPVGTEFLRLVNPYIVCGFSKCRPFLKPQEGSGDCLQINRTIFLSDTGDM